MSAYRILFGVEVVHGYFSDPTRCRLHFEPDAATALWLDRAGCLTRRSPNGLKVYSPTPTGPGARTLRAVLTGEPVALTFAVSPLDPEFSLYSDGLASSDGIEPGAPPLLAFDSARAALADLGQNRWTLSSPASGTRGATNVRADFSVVIRLAPDLSDAGRLYGISFDSRATVWKYLLIGDWAGDRPQIIDAANPDAGLFEDPFHGLEGPPPREQLADGRSAIPIRSTAPIALTDRPTRKIQLWSRSEAGARDRMLVPSLPYAAPGNLAVEVAAGWSTLVTEIYISR